jgi:hypothetical protein
VAEVDARSTHARARLEWIEHDEIDRIVFPAFARGHGGDHAEPQGSASTNSDIYGGPDRRSQANGVI